MGEDEKGKRKMKGGSVRKYICITLSHAERRSLTLDNICQRIQKFLK